MKNYIRNIEKVLRIKFNNKKLLSKSFIHKSYNKEINNECNKEYNNECNNENHKEWKK